MPRPLAALAGLLLSVAGAVLVTRPFTSLAVLVWLVALGLLALGVAELVDEPRPWPRRVLGLAGLWCAGAVAVLVWPGLTIRALAVLAGVLLVVDGATRVVGALRGWEEQRAAALLLGSAGVVLGLLALAWPDVTVLMVAIAVGVRVLWRGLTLLWGAARGPRPTSPERPAGPVRRLATLGASAVALLLAVALAGVSAWLHAGEPEVDDFYAAPDDLPAASGVLLRQEGFTRQVPDGAQAWRILYTTTRDEGEPAVASALVVAREGLGEGPHPVIAWAHGTTGQAQRCAPSVLDDPFSSGAMPALEQVLERGWVVVATDYVGLGTEGPHPYLIGQGEGRSVLDAVRAAREMDGPRLEDRTVVWGHSQGGGAALWTGVLAPDYAPDVGVIGVAALAPASDLPGMISNLGRIPGGALFAAYALTAYSEVYDDVAFDDYVRPAARTAMEGFAERCLAEPQTLLSVAESLAFDRPFYRRDPTSGPLGERLAENVPSGPIPAPVLLAQGEEDPLVLPDVQARFVQRRCDAEGSGPLDYRTYPGREHVDVIADDSPLVPELLAWTEDRLAGAEAPDSC